jgi:hypothetical protein
VEKTVDHSFYLGMSDFAAVLAQAWNFPSDGLLSVPLMSISLFAQQGFSVEYFSGFPFLTR